MDTLLVALLLLVPIPCGLLLYVATKRADECRDYRRSCETAVITLRGQVARVADVERDCESLRRELRKLAGKFYAQQSAQPTLLERMDATAVFCENYARAQLEGPLSKAAKCDCTYCFEKREARKSPAPAQLR